MGLLEGKYARRGREWREIFRVSLMDVFDKRVYKCLDSLFLTLDDILVVLANTRVESHRGCLELFFCLYRRKKAKKGAGNSFPGSLFPWKMQAHNIK